MTNAVVAVFVPSDAVIEWVPTLPVIEIEHEKVPLVSLVQDEPTAVPSSFIVMDLEAMKDPPTIVTVFPVGGPLGGTG